MGANEIKNGSLLQDAKSIIEQAQQEAFHSVNVSLIRRNWQLGKLIDEEILQGEERAEYGVEVIKTLSAELTGIYGKGFNKSSVYDFVRFYRLFPEIFQSAIGKSELLMWTHYSLLLNVSDGNARNWYAHEAYTETWSVRTLRRNIASQYYYRLLQFASEFPDEQIVSMLSTPLTWSHIIEILPLKDNLRCDFYVTLCASQRWSVHRLRKEIDSMLYERSAIASKPDELVRQELAALRNDNVLSPDLVFKSPYFWEFAGLKGMYSKCTNDLFGEE